MGRFRLVFALLAAALLVPAALLVHRALRGVEVEQEARHRTVAERVFDEMERALSDFVAREEERPVGAWSGEDGERLAALPGEPFLLGYFQVEPDGRVTTPLPPRDPAALRAASAWFAARAASRVDSRESAALAQAPGTTVPLAGTDAARLRALGYAGAEGRAGASGLSAAPETAYDALQSLNRGVLERAERQRKVVARPASEADAFEGKDEAVVSEPATPTAVAKMPQEEAGRREPVRIAVDPLVGRLASARHLLLYRTVLAGEAAFRQGLVLDAEPLGAWLRDHAIGALRLPGATLVFSTEPDGAPARGASSGTYVYRHRFAEPFDALSAALTLAPLGASDSARAIYALSALLLLVGAAGLAALYRMVAVAIGFAQRRANFVAAVTHELKTPLTAIRMYGEMLRDDLVPSEAKRREYYGTITAESERLSRLVDNVLEFARLERGTREMRLVAGPLGPAVEEATELMRPHAERQGFALRVALEPDLPPVRFERDALLQVLVNLIDNALKYARSAPTREIAVECRRSDGGVRISVRDRGPGVTGRHLGRIFEPFHRGGDELVRTTQGTGLGLALVRGLVERMGGTVGARNADEGGFEVRIALPAARA